MGSEYYELGKQHAKEDGKVEGVGEFENRVACVLEQHGAARCTGVITTDRGVSYNEQMRRDLWEFVRGMAEGGDINYTIREAERLAKKYGEGLPF